MNSRERVLAAIDHQESDGLPVDVGSTPSSGISAIAYSNLVKHMDLRDKRVWVYDVVQQVAQPSMEFLDHFHIDAVDVGRTFDVRDEDWYDYTLANGDTAQQPNWFKPEQQPAGAYLAYVRGEPIAKMPVGATYYDQTVFPFLDGYPNEYGANMDAAMGRIHWAALAHSPWDHAGEADFWQQLRANAVQLRQTTDRAIMVVGYCREAGIQPNRVAQGHLGEDFGKGKKIIRS